MQDTHFEIKLPVFEGPFDLLLFFIERDELDIHNIPIAKIANEFLDYMHHMESLNIELASEFILIAATLMRIKAKMLLPRYKKDDGGNEIDPRQDLIQQLLEYRRFKEATEEFKLKEELRMMKVERGNIQNELARIALEANESNYQSELETLTLYKLLTTFEKVMERFRNSSQNNHHVVNIAPYTIEQQRDFITNLVRSHKRCDFNEIFSNCENKLHAIYNFLALLEMIQAGFVVVVIGEGFNNFWISSPDNNFYAN
ncbi:MAG: segregation/condensation protein A [Bacteroidia bacterium]